LMCRFLQDKRFPHKPQGKRIELKITDPKDLARDVIKSDSCRIIVPELALELYSGTLGSRFTTIEGLLELVFFFLKSFPFSKKYY